MLNLKSQRMREANADKARLLEPARSIYLSGRASLSKCEEVAEKGNGGRGYVFRDLTKTDDKAAPTGYADGTPGDKRTSETEESA